jgi:hypothetical protein
MAPTLSNCKNYNDCGNSCMHAGSTCLKCFNLSAQERRGQAREQQTERRRNFQPTGAPLVPRMLSVPPVGSFRTLYEPVQTSRSHFQPAPGQYMVSPAMQQASAVCTPHSHPHGGCGGHQQQQQQQQW